MKIFHVILILILAPIFAFYLLVDLPSIKRNTEALIPEAARPEVMLIGRQVNAAVGGFFRGQLVVALIVGIMSSIALAIVDVPFWLLLGMVAGLFNIIPLVGPYIGGVPALLVALTTREPITGLWVVVAMVVVQQIDNHFISPVVMHRVVKLHPVLVMLALLLGGTLGGFFGLLVAVPATAILKIVGGHLWRVHVLGQPARGRGRPCRPRAGRAGRRGGGGSGRERTRPPRRRSPGSGVRPASAPDGRRRSAAGGGASRGAPGRAPPPGG